MKQIVEGALIGVCMGVLFGLAVLFALGRNESKIVSEYKASIEAATQRAAEQDKRIDAIIKRLEANHARLVDR